MLIILFTLIMFLDFFFIYTQNHYLLLTKLLLIFIGYFQKESDEARELKGMLVTLGFPKPPNNITAQQIFRKAEDKVSNVWI